MNTNETSEDDEEVIFEAWRKRILAKEEARTIRRTTPLLEPGGRFMPDSDLAFENGCWSPSAQSMKSRFLTT